MGRYVLTREIPAPPAEVFKAFTDPQLAADWLDATRIQDVHGDLNRAGSSYTLVIGGPWRFRSTVVRSEPPRLHETFHRGPFGADARMIATLEERAGMTHLELLTEYTAPLGPLGRWVDRRWLERGPRTAANRELDRLVALVSTPAPS